MPIDFQNRLWYKDAVFYEVYVRAFFDSNQDGHGDLEGLRQKLDYLQELGVSCIWLQPIYPSPLKDDGYDISDYFGILPEYGTEQNFKTLIEDAHQRGIRVIADLVLNHTSDQHPWFQQSRTSRSSPFRDYYVWSDSDQKYSQARIIFLDTEPSNWTWDETSQQYYWHRFYASQPDLNYDSPAVRAAMLDVARYWLEMGIDGFRADAVPYLFERDGTNCENLPETHAYLKELRTFLDQNYPGRILLCEANQWPEDVRPYFGDGDEFHMGFHFPVMPRIFMALRSGDPGPIRWILDRTPRIPEACQWATFLRNHDELTLEMVTEEERQWMWREYAPEPRMRLNLGIRRRLAPLLDNDRRKIELANSLLFTLPGSPVIYYGDEIGMGDDIWRPDRNGVRTPMQWDGSISAGFSGAPIEKFFSAPIESEEYKPARVNVAAARSETGSLLNVLKHMIAVRKAHLAFGRGEFTWAEVPETGILGFWRSYQAEQILCLHNLTPEKKIIDVEGVHRDLLGRWDSRESGKAKFEVAPFGYYWLM